MTDIIDSRDLIEELDTLRTEREALVDYFDDADADFDEVRDELRAMPDDDSEELREIEQRYRDRATSRDRAARLLADWENEFGERLATLERVNAEGEGYVPDWTYGEALIPENAFTDYAEQLAEDVGTIDRDQPWPLNCIDWEAAAEQLKQDYVEIEIEGQTYLARG
jgi:hypothetical protein